jgi:hypothetical protein
MSLSFLASAREMSGRQSRREGGSVTKGVTIENLLGDQLPIENHGGADGSRTHNLLNAISALRVSVGWS